MHYLAPRHQRLKVALPSPRLALPTVYVSGEGAQTMQAAIVANEAFQYVVDIRPLDVPTGSFHLSVHSAWQGAKDPQAQQTPFQATTDRAGLIALRDLIDQVLDSAAQPRAAG
jgi:hypothetical protein